MRAKRTPNDVTSPKPSISNHMTLTWVAIGDLKAHGRKARTHSRDQIIKIAESIKTFGFSVPIIVDDANRILAGHGRLEAARSLGMEKVPVVALSHLDEAQRRAFIIAENRMAELAGWDRSVLKAELEELSSLNLDFDLEVIGFADAEIEAIVLGGHEEADAADKTPPLPETPTSREGDLWLLGDHRLLCGDALDPKSLETVLGGEQAWAVFTDPPYNVAVQGHVTKRGAHREFAMASGEMSDADFTAFLAKVWAQLEQGLVPGGLAYVCMDWRHVAHVLKSVEERAFEQLNLIVWDKQSGGMGSHYRSRHELIFLMKRTGDAHTNRVQLGKNGRDRSNVWSYPGMSGAGAEKAHLRGLHPTVKPVAMVKDALLDCSRKGDVVLDLFSGSGTTLLAAHMVGRRGRAIDLDPIYCDVGIARWEAFTGQEARHAETGETFTRMRVERAAAASAEGR